MIPARSAISRHVGRCLVSGCSGGGSGGSRTTALVRLRREVGGGIKDGIVLAPRAVSWSSRRRRRGSVDRQVRLLTTNASPSHIEQISDANPPAKTKRPVYIRLPIALALTLLTFTTGFIMAGAPALQSLQDLANPPTDAETLELYTPSTSELAEIEALIFAHPLTKSLLADPKYIASRPHLKIPEQLRAQNLTGGTLLGADKIAVPPVQFSTADGSHFVSLQYLGHALCGHPGIVHGGLLATLLDEGLARCCFPALPNKVGVTASLKIDYKAPCMAGQIVVLRAETTKVEGRKAWVKGRLETLGKAGEWEEGKTDGVVLTEAEALFIEPRQAAQMKRVVN